jgi:signal transduction histidine kinase
VLVNRVLDLAERERRERALDELHDATRRLVRAREKDRIADRATDAAEEILGFTLNGVRFYDEAADVLRPASMTEDVTEAAGDRPVYERGEAVHWRVFESGEPVVFEDVSDIDDDQHRSGSGGVMYYPLGEHGVLSIGREGERGFSELDRQFARLLVANTRAALDLADRARELERREAELARRNDHLEEFTSTVCHDLRNPLNIAMGGVTLARDAVDETPAERLDRALDALDRMESLLEHSHDLAQQGQAVAGDELDRVNPAAVAEQAWRTVDTGAASLDAGPAGTVQADPERLRTLFENLFRNAVEHGGDDVTVTVAPLNDRQRADGGFDESWQGFRVADDGDGIPSAVRESVFARGYTTDDDGTGFGLATVRTIAESHGWDIDVTDSDAGGACFEIRV